MVNEGCNPLSLHRSSVGSDSSTMTKRRSKALSCRAAGAPGVPPVCHGGVAWWRQWGLQPMVNMDKNGPYWSVMIIE